MNNPIEINAFRHFLEVNGTRTEILEPIGFDASNFVCEQDKDNYGRDIFYGNSEADLEFHYEYGINELPSGLEIILEQEQLNGSEADVNYVLQKSGVDFTIGQLDFAGATTDYKSYFKCKVIQNNEQAKIKKRKDIKVDAFATKDLDDNTITPIATEIILLKAKPITRISEWIVANEFSVDGSLPGVNMDIVYPFIQIKKNGISDTLTPVFNYVIDIGNQKECKIIRAVNNTKNIKLKGRLKYRLNDTTSAFTFNVKTGSESGSAESNSVSISLPTTYNTIINHSFEVSLPNAIESSEILWAYFLQNLPTVSALSITIYEGELEVTATETGISSVIKGVRYIDLIKQNYKAIGSLPVNAQKFDIGGQFYEQFCFSGKLIRQITNEPFYLKLSDTNESLQEVNACAQINDNEIYIGQYNDFYKDTLMGTYLQIPTADASFMKNDRYLINSFKFGYSKYEQDRDEDGTLDAIHTDSEWFVPNNNSINDKELKLPFIRDAYKIESVRRRATEKSGTSNDSDDDIFIVDVIELAPGATNSITGTFTIQQSDENNTYKILANQNFRWDLLGFSVGDTMSIFDGTTTLNLVVSEITPGILTMIWGGGSSSGSVFLTLTYPLTNINYTIRTSEGLTFGENLSNADNYANLRYSIKRNMSHWFPYLATAGKFIPTKTIKNSYFKSNGNATTKFVGETANIKENQDITISSIASQKILNQNMYKTTLVIEFEDLVTLMGKIQTERGYINVQEHDGNLISGYIVELDHTWASNECEITLEIKN
jgi:hypothetical protein